MPEAPAVIASFDDIAMVGDAVERRSGHLGIAEDGGPLAERQVGGDDHRGLLVEPADQVEQQLSAGLGERQIAELVEDRGGSGNGPVGRFPDEGSRGG